MTVNINKTKEIVFHRPSAQHSLPIPLIGIEQVLFAKLLGVTFSSNLKFDDHAKNVLTICSQRYYLLRYFKGQGLPAKELNIVFCAIVMSLTAWGGFLTYELR